MSDSTSAPPHDWRDDVDRMHAHDRAVAAGTACPQCGHDWWMHTKDEGCYSGWKLASDLSSGGDGCGCKLAHVDQSPTDSSGIEP